jgi:electron transfer flavoprotein alpha subunit
VKEVVTVEHAALDPYTPDGFTAALQDAIAQLAPAHVLLPHTYQTRDFAPNWPRVSTVRSSPTSPPSRARAASRRSCGRCSRAS